jgi:hypothetical protein
MYDISIIMPAIRVPRWDHMYDTISKSCKKYSFELVICGPFGLTEKLSKLQNVKAIIDYGSPSRCAQIAAVNASGKLLAHLVDDAIFLEDSLDEAIDLYYEKCGKKDMVNLRYTEGLDHKGEEIPLEYWTAWYHPALRLPGVPSDYKMSCHHIIDKEYFSEIGGYDCSYEYQNFNLHDFMFRVQYDGGKVFDSITRVTNCDHYPNGMVDHRAIEEAMDQNDFPLFRQMYSNPEILKTRKVHVDNWQETSPIWTRRFKFSLPETYDDIVKNN